jgi:hypothetical protein
MGKRNRRAIAAMKPQRIEELIRTNRDGLLNDTLPF